MCNTYNNLFWQIKSQQTSNKLLPLMFVVHRRHKLVVFWICWPTWSSLSSDNCFRCLECCVQIFSSKVAEWSEQVSWPRTAQCRVIWTPSQLQWEEPESREQRAESDVWLNTSRGNFLLRGKYCWSDVASFIVWQWDWATWRDVGEYMVASTSLAAAWV